MEMNMNFSEYMRCKQIVNYIFGGTIDTVKCQNELANMDFITVERLDDDKIDINSKSSFL